MFGAKLGRQITLYGSVVIQYEVLILNFGLELSHSSSMTCTEGQLVEDIGIIDRNRVETMFSCNNLYIDKVRKSFNADFQVLD